MFVNKQIPSFCKLYSFYEDIPEVILDETDVDSYFYRNIFGIPSPSIETCELAEAPTKNHFQKNCSSFAI